jgi:hypothetical protein
MRTAEYEIAGPDGASPATLAVYHFPGGGGKVQANIDRWTGQFQAEQGDVDPQTEIRTIDGMKVHTVDLSGTFNAGVGMGSGEPKENYRLLAAIAEADRGKVVFKMVGPAPTIAAHAGEFETSLMMHLTPKLVQAGSFTAIYRDESLERAKQDMFDEGPLSVSRTFDEYTDTGTIGDPTCATAEKGETIYKGLVKELGDIVCSTHDVVSKENVGD